MKENKLIKFFGVESWRLGKPIIDLGFFKLYGYVHTWDMGFWKGLFHHCFPFIVYEIKESRKRSPKRRWVW